MLEIPQILPETLIENIVLSLNAKCNRKEIMTVVITTYHQAVGGALCNFFFISPDIKKVSRRLVFRLKLENNNKSVELYFIISFSTVVYACDLRGLWKIWRPIILYTLLFYTTRQVLLKFTVHSKFYKHSR